MFFPWELFGDDGNFISQEQFGGLEELANGNMVYRHERKLIYPVCRAIWERAQKEISEADKISFVGMSFHTFLKRGLEFLFSSKNRTKPPSNLVFVGPQFHPSSGTKGTLLFNKALGTLKTIFPGIFGGIGITNLNSYENFAAFIREEMD